MKIDNGKWKNVGGVDVWPYLSLIFVEDDEGGDHTRDPTDEGEDEGDEDIAKALVINGEWWEEDGEDNAEYGHLIEW